MNNFEAVAFSSSQTTFTSVGNEYEASTSSSSGVVIYSGLSKFSFDLVISYIDDVLSAITNESLRCKMADSGMKLRDMVEPIASDFSKLCEAMSQGAKMFSEQKSLTSNLSSEAHTVALDVLKGVGNAHWAAVGLLAIANVLERLDKISTNDRDCIDLLKGMLDLAKFIKMLKDINADFHGAILGKMSEALHLIVSGAILCHSFIRCTKISKFLLNRKISEELVYVRGKVDRMKTDLSLQMNYIIMTSVTLPKTQTCTRDSQGRLQNHQTVYTGDEKELSISESQVQCVMQEDRLPESNNQSNLIHDDMNSSKKNVDQPQEMPLPTKSRLARYLKYTANGLKRIAGYKLKGCQMPVHTLSWKQAATDLRMTVNDDQLSKFATEMGLGWLPIRFTLEELLLATNGFQRQLGKGGFGSTYMGTLSDGRQVAIKKSWAKTDGLIKEMVCMVNLHHRNIMKLVGFCFTGNELLLVSDFMSNGCLSDHLFDPTNTVALDWPTRWKIIEAVISALLYLQEGADVCVVHRDIKPSNILLDENFNARVSDFGIARTLPNTRSASIPGFHERITSLNAKVDEQLSDTEYSTQVCGTRGYIAPESMMNGHVTRKTDIYSFGVLLLNLVSGKKSLVFRNIEEGMYSIIVQAFALHRDNRVEELIDPDLEKMGGFEEEKALRSLLIAMWCVQADPNLRPSVSQVSLMLSKQLEISPPPDILFPYVYSGQPDQSPVSSVSMSLSE